MRTATLACGLVALEGASVEGDVARVRHEHRSSPQTPVDGGPRLCPPGGGVVRKDAALEAHLGAKRNAFRSLIDTLRSRRMPDYTDYTDYTAYTDYTDYTDYT
eukprot:340202-Prorocentrum_minimum.AAC.1